MKQPTIIPQLDTKPVIAKWELWSVAQMLVATHGDDAENHAQAKLAEAKDLSDEADQIVWSGVIAQLKRLREE
jgi:hypothetical protein